VALVARSRASDGRTARAVEAVEDGGTARAVEAGSVAGRAPEALEAAAPVVMAAAARTERSVAAAKREREVRRLGGNPNCGALIPC
jgi:hypothetical protein